MEINSCIYNKLIKPINFNGQNSANKTECNTEQQSQSVFGAYYQPILLSKHADLQAFWDDIKYENPEKEYFNPDRGPYIAPNIEAIRKLSILDNCGGIAGKIVFSSGGFNCQGRSRIAACGKPHARIKAL